MSSFTVNPATLRLVLLVLVGVLFGLGVDPVAGDHTMCLSDGPDIREKDGLPCVWMDGFLTSNDIMGYCQSSFCKPFSNKGGHNNFIFRGLVQRIRDLNDRAHHWNEHY